MISKMKPDGSRLGIVLSGSPLFSGAAGSGESEIRRWIIENDWLEGIVALADQMFYNTGISTYVWILTKLIDARDLGTKMRKSLGDKRKELTRSAIDEIVALFGDAQGDSAFGVDGADEARIKILPNEAFGFQRITVERPLRRTWVIAEETLAVLPEESRGTYASLVGKTWTTGLELATAMKALGGAEAKDVKALLKAAEIHDPVAR